LPKTDKRPTFKILFPNPPFVQAFINLPTYGSFANSFRSTSKIIANENGFKMIENCN
jgi:hypothetical protein